MSVEPLDDASACTGQLPMGVCDGHADRRAQLELTGAQLGGVARIATDQSQRALDLVHRQQRTGLDQDQLLLQPDGRIRHFRETVCIGAREPLRGRRRNLRRL
jgi:hypothetical protein